MVVLLILSVVVVIIVIVAIADQKKHDDKEAAERKRWAEEYNREWHKLQRENEDLKRENEEWGKEFSQLVTYQNAGMDREKAGDIEGAIEQYEYSVTFGLNSKRMGINNYYHSIERLAICYRKMKRYQDEVDLLEQAFEFDLNGKTRADVTHRLEKAKQLLNKSNK